MNVAERLAEVRTEIVALHAQRSTLEAEEERLRASMDALIDNRADPADDQGLEIVPIAEPDLPCLVEIGHSPAGVALRPGPASHEAAERRKFETAVRTYRSAGAVATAVAMRVRPIDVLGSLEAMAQRWPTVDNVPVCPLFPEERAAFLREVAKYCAAMGGIAAAAATRKKEHREVAGWIDEGVRAGVIEWPPPGDVGRAVFDLVG